MGRNQDVPPGGSSYSKVELLTLGDYSFRLARLPEELEQISRLLHQTFVLEVRQDADTGTGALIDKFHHKNTYLVAVHRSRICGMVAVHDQPPFSAASGLECEEILEPLRPKLLEVRRLAVEPARRSGAVFPGLIWSVHEYAEHRGYRYILISGLVKRRAMYEKLGFRPLGKAVRKGDAYFLPMLADLRSLPEPIRQERDRWERRIGITMDQQRERE